jgi:hypothetical protein
LRCTPSRHELAILQPTIQAFYTYSGVCKDKKKGRLYKFIKRPKFGNAIKEFIRETRRFSIEMNDPVVIGGITNIGGLWFREMSLNIERKVQYTV